MANKPKNAYLAKLEQEKQDRARIAQYVNERQSLDALIVAINEEFGFGAERISRASWGKTTRSMMRAIPSISESLCMTAAS